ncbi:MAG TPA: regulatory protein RecX [Bacillota bacterium]|jgi:regulatory protein|nr:regulatory protein RecX [Bacillota bacterium]HOB87075.1 regulatory protein RecX [Bacillota bacterium]HPZ64069.1 regulatory protein RecX [Bacillota bacterium]HQD06381.1 regulatory protein RecX [Bacillota bacterium]
MADESILKKARGRALRYLGYRPRTGKELADYLRKGGYEEQVIAAIMKEMMEYGYIDDRRFADDYIRSSKLRGIGLRRAVNELKRKGIARSITEECLKLYDAQEEEAQAKALVEKKIRNRRGGLDRKAAANLGAYLYRRGFRSDVIRHVLRECLEQETLDELS